MDNFIIKINYLWNGIWIYMSKKNTKRRRKDPSLITLIEVFLIIALGICLLKDHVYIRENSWIIWILLGFGLTILYDAFMREIHEKYRWSTFLRLVMGIVLLCLGFGMMYGFRILSSIYVSIFASLVFYYLFHKKQLKWDESSLL